MPFQSLSVIFYLALCFISSATAENRPAAVTTPGSTSRYELVQSNIAAKWTFLLDRFEGRVYQLVLTEDGNNTWEGMLVVGSPTSYKKPSYQIFTSGIAARHTFLLDTENGTTWTLTTQKGKTSEHHIWSPFINSALESKKAFEKLKEIIIKDIVDSKTKDVSEDVKSEN